MAKKVKEEDVTEERAELLAAAKELNKVLGLEPSIDLKLDNAGLKKVLKEAASFITEDDVITSDVRTTLEGLEFLAPTKKTKSKKVAKPVPAPEEEEEEEDVPEAADDDDDEDEEEDEDEDDAEDIPIDDDEEEAPVTKKAKVEKPAAKKAPVSRENPKWRTAIELIVANPKITAEELEAEMTKLPSGAYNGATSAVYVREIGLTIELYKKSLKK